jgi:glycosyltransferase involved in cell wall biosynthesis
MQALISISSMIDAGSDTLDQTAANDSRLLRFGGIAAVLPSFDCAGAQRDTILLCNALANRGLSAAIFVLRPGGVLKPLVDPAVRIIELPGERIRYAIPGLRAAIRSLAPHVVLSSGANLNLCCLAAVLTLPRAERPKVVLREVNAPGMARRHDPRWQDRLAYRVLRYAYRAADRIITLTDGARRELIEQFSVPPSGVVVMHSNAVITREVVVHAANWDGERGRERDLIVAIGRLSPEKNFQLLLRAVGLLRPGRPWRLAIVGEGEERSILQRYVVARSLEDRVSFVGFAADPFYWLRRARVMVSCSLYEGLGNTIIESLACGTPVVATDCPFGPREVLENGRYGSLVPVGNPEALARAIDAALDLAVDRAALVRRGLNYTAERAAAEFLRLLSKLMQQHPVSHSRKRHKLFEYTNRTTAGDWQPLPRLDQPPEHTVRVMPSSY